MSKQYVAPDFKERSFTCGACGVYSQQDWTMLKTPNGIYSKIFICQCLKCRFLSYWKESNDEGMLIYPHGINVAPPINEDANEDVKLCYQEAASIASLSPRAAAALLRLALEHLLNQLSCKGSSINKKIESLVAQGLPQKVQQALDYTRIIGNHAVHPKEIQLNDSPEIVQALFWIINFIIDEMITKPKAIGAFYQTLPQNLRDAIDKREHKKQDQESTA